MLSIKEQLFQHCQKAVREHIDSAKRGIDTADEAVKSETKGSAGDDPSISDAAILR